MVKRVPLAFAMIAMLTALDQWSKYLVETRLPYRESIEVMPFFAFFRTFNDGVAFSMLSGFGVGGLMVIGAVVFVLVLWLWSKVEKGRPFTHLGFALISAGALGNLIDRATLGYVIDFIQFHTVNWSFAIFNVSDTYISVGVAAIIIDEILAWKKQKNTESE